jgi:hypothetical protein
MISQGQLGPAGTAQGQPRDSLNQTFHPGCPCPDLLKLFNRDSRDIFSRKKENRITLKKPVIRRLQELAIHV